MRYTVCDMTFDDFKSLCEQRHSVRTFSETPVSEEAVLQLLDLARMAPNVENLQPWHFHVITNQKLRRNLMECCCYGNVVESNGTLIVVTANRSVEADAPQTVWNPVELQYSCTAAMENIVLGATAMGLGSTWVSLLHGTAHEALGLPHHEIIIGGILLGHRLHEDREPPPAHDRKPLKDIVTFHA